MLLEGARDLRASAAGQLHALIERGTGPLEQESRAEGRADWAPPYPVRPEPVEGWTAPPPVQFALRQAQDERREQREGERGAQREIMNSPL